MSRRLTLRFETLNSFQQEFQKDIAHGGVFIPSDGHFGLRERVEVVLDLAFCEQRAVLEAEVVSALGPGAVRAGGRRGVAVQFLESANMLRLLLSEMAGIEPPPPPPAQWPGREGPARRRTRTRTRISAALVSGGVRRAAHTLNLSASGALLVPEGSLIPVGDDVEVHLVHPRTGEERSIDGVVARHALEDGVVAGLGVHFANDPDAETPTTAFLEDLLAAAHARQLGGVTGTLGALGAPSVVQMFANAAAAGTLLLTRPSEEGRVLFEGGALRYVALGRVTSLKALARLLAWTEGAFEFRPTVEEGEPQGVPIPIDGAMLEALQHVDELQRLDTSKLPLSGLVEAQSCPDDAASGELSALEQGVLALASRTRSVAQILDALPEFDSEICEVLLALLERGRVRVRG